MKTEDLITIMSQDAAMPRLTPGRLWPWLALALLGSVATLWWLFGPRPDLSVAITHWPLITKLLLGAVFTFSAGSLLQRAFYPENTVRDHSWRLLLPLALAAALVLLALLATPAEERLQAVIGQTLLACLMSIPLLGLPMLAVMLWILRKGAPAEPGFTGLIVGLCAGGLSMGIYALHCTEDNPAFFGLWYASAAMLLGLIGYLLGRRLLSW